MAVDADDFLKDAASAFGPDKRLGIGVVVSHIIGDFGDQFIHIGEHATTKSPLMSRESRFIVLNHDRW